MELLDRADALAAADARVLLVVGPAGIGKTSVLEAIAARADRPVLQARGTPLEQDYALGVARQLLGEVGPPGADLAVVLHYLFLALVDRAPVLIVVDDAHWADDVSLRLLAYTARRLEGLDVRLVVAARTVEHEALSALEARTVTLGPLGVDAVERLVGAELAEACHRASGGNPLLVAELLRTLPSDAAPADIDGTGLERTVLDRLLPLGDGPRAFAEAAAVLGPGAAPHVTARLAGLDPEAAAAARDTLVGAQILAPGARLDFVHALVATAVVAALPPGRLALEHARAARIRAEAGEGPAAVAAHLLEADPAGDPGAVEHLRAAANEALASGGSAEAARLLRRALAEPPPADQLGALLHEAGTAATRAGDADGDELLQRALEHTEEPERRVAILIEQHLMASVEGRVDVLPAISDAMRDAARDASPAVRTMVEARTLQIAAMNPARMDDAFERARRVDRALRPADAADRVLLASVAAIMVHDDATAGEIADLSRRAVADDRGYEQAVDAGVPVYFAFLLLALADAEPELIDARFSLALRRASERGSLISRALGLGTRCVVDVWRGRLAQADADAAEALAIGDAAGRAYDPSRSWAVRLDVALQRHDLAAAREMAEGARAVSERGLTLGVVDWELRTRFAAIALAEGDARAALAEALVVRDAIERSGSRAVAWAPWPTVAARAQRALGDEDAARATAAAFLDGARAFGAPWIVGEALLLASETAEDPIATLEEAVAVLERSLRPLVRARALIALGAALRRANRRAEAREPLAAGRELAHECGAEALGDIARQELLAAGARPRKIVRSGADALTASELRTAQLAAGGATNREIASALFVTVKTVEDHLSAAYRKLDIRGRKELAGKVPG